MRELHPSKGLFLSFVLTALACGGAPEPADTAESPLSAKTTVSKTPAYLALGDSVPFGYDPTLLPPKTLNQLVGYPTYLSAAVNKPLTDPTCPGETSGSFLRVETDNGCGDFKAAFGLHEDYAAARATTQRDFALAFLASHPQIQLVTLTIGANDVLLLQKDCQKVADADVAKCISDGLPSTLQNVLQNVVAILAAVRQARPTVRIIVTLYYSPSAETVALVQALNSFLFQAASLGGADVIVDLKEAFDRASVSFNGDPCAAGLLVLLPDGTCDIHPSQKGHKLIAATLRPAAL